MSSFGVLQSLILSGSELKNKRDTQVNVIIAWRKGSRLGEKLRMQYPPCWFWEGKFSNTRWMTTPNVETYEKGEELGECLMLRSSTIFFSFSMKSRHNVARQLNGYHLFWPLWMLYLRQDGRENGREKDRQNQEQIQGIGFYKGGRVGKGRS